MLMILCASPRRVQALTVAARFASSNSIRMINVTTEMGCQGRYRSLKHLVTEDRGSGVDGEHGQIPGWVVKLSW